MTMEIYQMTHVFGKAPTRAAGAIILGATVALGSCSDPDGARRHLEDAGYTSIVMTGSPWFAGCDKHEYYVDTFEAKSVAGRDVKGVVCSGVGWGKATTIRMY